MTCNHTFPTTPPRGTMDQPGDCRTCGTSYQNAKAQMAAAEETSTGPEAWRTDPRERLLAAIDRTWARGTFDATPEQLVDEYAHQLAEQQRHHFGVGDAPVKAHCAVGCDFCRGVSSAADLIDPKAKP